MILIAGTRGSTLALKQVDIITAKLLDHAPSVKVETRVITTSGDRFRDRPIEAINEKGVFTKAIDEAVLSGEVSFAVHSMKDLPMEIPDGLTVAAVPERASPKDAFISEKFSGIADLPSGAVVGTASPRRKAQFLHLRSDVKTELIRGNVDTRLGKLSQGEYDAIILAESGLVRLNKGYVITKLLSLEAFTPTACQGALALVTKKDNVEVIEVLRKLTHRESWNSTIAERSFMTTIGGGCKTPIGVYVNESMELVSSVLAPDGSIRLQYKKSGKMNDPEEFGREAALDMLDQGAARLIERWR
ncbi:MAG: hydroxymethylbilane synthase [Candidatus Bathyarchaeota archaeon]|nr:hydroxymethylbilane synthase [Candidatus Bathyarchaeota archaeon]